MKFELNLKNTSVNDDELITDLKRVAERLNKNTVTIEDYNNFGNYHSTTIQRRFRSWFKALQLAQLEQSRPDFNIDNELLLSNIANVWMKLGKQPSAKDMKKPLSEYGGNTYLRHFGSWNNALLEFIKSVETNKDEVSEKNTDISEINTEKETIRKDTRTISLRLRFSIFLRDGFRCQSCGKSPVTHPGIELHCDHIIPWSKGGRTNFDNLKTLCSECNLGKGNMIEEKEW